MFDDMKSILKNTAKTIAVLLFMCAGFADKGFAQQKFERTAFYNVMDNGDLPAIDNELQLITASSLANKGGYEGAMLMRKAGKAKGPKKKLGFFKEGRIKLETAILADPDNTEFRFLRLAIEENAPKIVKYKKDIEADKAFILAHFKTQPQSVQQAILNYTKNSKVLHAEDFK